MSYFDISPEFDFQDMVAVRRNDVSLYIILNTVRNGFSSCYYIILRMQYIIYKHCLRNSPSMLTPLQSLNNTFIQILIFGIFKYLYSTNVFLNT